MRRISEVTRRDIVELFDGKPWWGRLDEVSFLSRLHNLSALPSTDSRHADADGDIRRHRYANNDWDDDWVFEDERFGLAEGDDTTLLSFLSEFLHPAVQSSKEDTRRWAEELNALLVHDGYRLIPKHFLSGRPVYGWEEVEPAAPEAEPVAEPHFTEDVTPLVQTLARLAELQGARDEARVLDISDATLEEPEYDNLDGGTYYYTLTLALSPEEYARLGNEVSEIENSIIERSKTILRTPDRHHITAVAIRPRLERTRASSSRVTQTPAQRIEQLPAFWAPGRFRLFISHVSAFKVRAAALRQFLWKYHISGFVAHEFIEPGELWQREIESALGTMDALVALLTPEFPNSRWTDQEVGWALGRGVYVLPVRRQQDPYGFIGEVQGIQGLGQSVGQVAELVFRTLLRVSTTRPAMLNALTAGLAKCETTEAVQAHLRLLREAGKWEGAAHARLISAAQTNRILGRGHIREIENFPRIMDR